MFLLFTLAFPGVLLALVLAMERVEAPLRDEAVGERVTQFLDVVRPDEVETFVSEGLDGVLNRYWRRRSLKAKLLTRRLAARS